MSQINFHNGEKSMTSDIQTTDPLTMRVTNFGVVNGIDYSTTTGVYAWLGIPYAQPPVDSLRWMPPIDPVPWTDILATQQFGQSCAQAGRYYSPAPNNEQYGLRVRECFNKPVGNEDCLTLNIWSPSEAKGLLPVIVFIHGGSNVSGYSADPIYDGQVLAKKANAVVVTINYRLGILGWLDLPQLKTGDALTDSGNFGLLDQLHALKFVKNNIAEFGGDPNNVTLIGQSAGAVNVWNLLISPLSVGLFHKAMPLSGGLLNSSRAKAQTYSEDLLRAIVVADGKAKDINAAKAWLNAKSSKEIAAYLRHISADDLLNVVIDNPQLGDAPAPIEDGNVIPVDSLAALAEGRYQKVPVIAGNTKDEGTTFSKLFGTISKTGIDGLKPNDFDRFSMEFHFDPDSPSLLTEADFISHHYLPVSAENSGWNALSTFVTQSMFIAAVKPPLDSLVLQQPDKVWYYRFDWDEAPAPFDKVYGATHSLDLPFVFGNFNTNIFSFAYSKANQAGREALSDAMIASLAAFAKTGNPNTPELGVTWENYPKKIVLDASATLLRISNE
ncbi:carboxylesterase [Acinetobacter pittii]|nr:carboxylesterase [Acinetobacter pittii]